MSLFQERGARDDRPFAELFRRYAAFVWNICYRFTGNAEDAEDLLQEVFFKVYRHLYQFKGAASFKTWLYRVAVNTARNESRRRSRRPQLSDTPIEILVETWPADDTTESTRAERARNANLVLAWACLRPAEQDVLRLRDLEGRPYTEIAQLLNLSPSAAKMRVQRARLALRRAYRLQESEEP